MSGVKRTDPSETPFYPKFGTDDNWHESQKKEKFTDEHDELKGIRTNCKKSLKLSKETVHNDTWANHHIFATSNQSTSSISPKEHYFRKIVNTTVKNKRGHVLKEGTETVYYVKGDRIIDYYLQCMKDGPKINSWDKEFANLNKADYPEFF